MEGSLNCARCGNQVSFLLGKHCEECCKIAKVGNCTQCHLPYNFFPERHDFNTLEDKFDFLCDNCKCVQCQKPTLEFFKCCACGFRTCIVCAGNVKSHKRFVCILCKCRKCKRSAKNNCEANCCAQHCDLTQCIGHPREGGEGGGGEGGGEKKELKLKITLPPPKRPIEREEIEISSSDPDIGELAFRLLTVKEKLVMIQNDPRAKQKEDTFREKVAANGSFGECVHYLSEWQMQLNRQQEEMNQLQKEKEVLKSRQQNEFKRLRTSKPNETENF